jgi:hypothetical protein
MGRIERLYARGEKHFDRWLRTQSRSELDAAIAAFTELDTLVRPGDDLLRIAVDGQLGPALIGRHKLADSPADLSAAITHLKRVVASPDLPDDTDVDPYHLLLGEALTDRIERYASPDFPFPLPGDEEFLGELRMAVDSLAIAASSDADALAPAARAEAARLRAYLLPKLATGNAMAARKAGWPADLRELERTLHELPDDHPVRSRLILELGFAHMYWVIRDTTMSPSPRSSAHREPAASYLAQALTLLAPGGRMSWRPGPLRQRKCCPGCLVGHGRSLRSCTAAATRTWPHRSPSPTCC